MYFVDSQRVSGQAIRGLFPVKDIKCKKGLYIFLNEIVVF
jgi:hypothetical protein